MQSCAGTTPRWSLRTDLASFVVAALTSSAYVLPELLACGIGLAMLWTSAAPGRARSLGLAGIGLMLGCALLQLALGLNQQWTLHALQASDGYADIGALMGVLNGVRVLVNCISMAGLVLLAWALCKATRATQTGWARRVVDTHVFERVVKTLSYSRPARFTDR